MKSGFVAILGRPNVGKSTLMNHILNQKISIVTDKSQTTRNNIKGIYTTKEYQIIFVDTPGIHKPQNTLGSFMVKEANNAVGDVDVVMWLVESGDKIGPVESSLIKMQKPADCSASFLLYIIYYYLLFSLFFMQK